jgi:hypothetical protein
MPIDTFIVYVRVYPDVYAAEADYERAPESRRRCAAQKG